MLGVLTRKTQYKRLKGESYERGAGKEKQENLFDLFEVLDMFMIN